MIQHDAHLSTPNYKNADRVMMVICTYPKRQVMEILPYSNAMHFVSVFFLTNSIMQYYTTILPIAQ
jgi:hypothetical protein